MPERRGLRGGQIGDKDLAPHAVAVRGGVIVATGGDRHAAAEGDLAGHPHQRCGDRPA